MKLNDGRTSEFQLLEIWMKSVRQDQPQTSELSSSESHEEKEWIRPDTPDYFFKVGDMVKLKHHERLKLEFKWKGPYHVVDVGHPGTYWLMTPQGLRFPNAINQSDLAPWLAPVIDNADFFYDGTPSRSIMPQT
ncbi:hypothetical protein BASA81_013142 [Batrachochytrium salamandrivorans]|nr:hypothetical protein BASA81_013142 [Batrachochytrium salamandrivorans]